MSWFNSPYLLLAHRKLDLSCVLRERPPAIPFVDATHGKFSAQDRHVTCEALLIGLF